MTHSLRGITAPRWWKLLRSNRFAIDPVYRRRAFAVTVRSIRTSIYRVPEERQFGDAITAARVPPPLFILGHWRSGTTLVHELMALDDQFAYPNLFEVSNPQIFLSLEDRVAPLLEEEEPVTRPMDNMRIAYSSPGEDEAALAVACLRSPVIAWAFPRRVPYYDRYYTFDGVPEREVQEWKATALWFWKKLTVRHGRPLLLKSPPHTGRIRHLLSMFPTARFVHITRDPYTVFRSTQRLYATAVPMAHLQRAWPEQIDEEIIYRYALVYDAYFEQQPSIPADQFCEIRFEDLERDPVGQIGVIYQRLGLDGFERVEPRLEQYARSRSDYRKNQHEPLPEPLRRRLAEAWERCFATWGYPTAGEMAVRGR